MKRKDGGRGGRGEREDGRGREEDVAGKANYYFVYFIPL